ncbi:hypothetical protein [Roseofilum reptotaenium]|nr:hypothetical protein [Roseofilum reptotaenium]
MSEIAVLLLKNGIGHDHKIHPGYKHYFRKYEITTDRGFSSSFSTKSGSIRDRSTSFLIGYIDRQYERGDRHHQAKGRRGHGDTKTRGWGTMVGK